MYFLGLLLINFNDKRAISIIVNKNIPTRRINLAKEDPSDTIKAPIPTKRNTQLKSFERIC